MAESKTFVFMLKMLHREGILTTEIHGTTTSARNSMFKYILENLHRVSKNKAYCELLDGMKASDYDKVARVWHNVMDEEFSIEPPVEVESVPTEEVNSLLAFEYAENYESRK